MELELLAGQRQPGETDRAVLACNDYLRMGPGRSLANLLERYQSGTESAPTRRLTTLKDWSRKYGWKERVVAYDATQEERKNEARAAEFEDGLALDYERVRRLKRLAAFLEGQIYQTDETGAYANVWLPDVKGIGGKDNFERVEIVKFNQALIDEYRQTLADIAAETGGRVRRNEHTGPGGGALQIQWVDPLVDDDEIGIGAEEFTDAD